MIECSVYEARSDFPELAIQVGGHDQRCLPHILSFLCGDSLAELAICCYTACSDIFSAPHHKGNWF